MEMETMRDLGAQGGAMKQFAKFCERANPQNFEALEALLKAFNKTDGDDFEGTAIEGLVRFMASRTGGKVSDEQNVAENLGYAFQRAVKRLFKECAAPQIELVTNFLYCIENEERKERDPLAVMRELATSEAPPNGYPYFDNSDKQMLWCLRKMERPYVLTYPTLDGKSEKTMNLSAAEATEAVKLMEPLMKGIRSWEEEEADLEAGKVVEPAESLSNLDAALHAAEPKGEEGEQPEPISEVDNLDRKFRELKKKGAPLDWLSLFLTNSDSIDLTEAEFSEALTTIRQMRRGQHLAIPSKTTVDDAIALLLTLVTLGLRAQGRINAATDSQPSESAQEPVGDPVALEEAVAAFDRYTDSLRPRAMEAQAS